MGIHSKTSYIDVRKTLLAELSTHAQDHEILISSAYSKPSKLSTKTQIKQPSFAVEAVQDLLMRLDHYEEKCTEGFWLRMPYMGYVIASAYDRPTILFDPDSACSVTFFPYRTTPNLQEPILLAFINNNHFVSLKPQGFSVPFPELYGWSRSRALLETTRIPAWIEQYQSQLDSWLDLRLSSSYS